MPRFVSVISLAFAAFWTFLGIYLVQPPAPEPKETPATAFSGARAMDHIRTFARVPHTMGTPENQRVRDYILDTLNTLKRDNPAFNLEIQLDGEHVERNTRHSPYKVCYVENILARVAGEAPSKAFLVMAHYDSVAWGPGAADDGSGIAAMLETLRVLAADAAEGRHLRNDVIFLFTDGEEVNLLGPKAFRKHPWFNDVGLVLNFEARGIWGPSYMFETSDHNGWLIREFAKAAPYPVASSLMFDVSDRMPTSTDYAVLRDDNIPGMNCAFIGGLAHYHTMNDNPEQIDQRSVQHHGSYALSLTRHFGNANLNDTDRPNAVYFNGLGHHLIVYPASWTPFLAALALIAYALFLTRGLRHGVLAWRRVAASALLFLLAVVLSTLAVAALMVLGWAMHREYLLYIGPWIMFGAIGFTFGVLALLYRPLFGRASVAEVSAGVLFWWCGFLVAALVWMPSGAYLATWPLLFGVVMLGGLAVMQSRGFGHLSQLAWALVCAIPALVLVPVTIYGCYTAMTAILAPFWMAFVLLNAAAVFPLFCWTADTRRPWFGILLALAGLGVFFAGMIRFEFTPEQPKMNSLCYGLNFDRNQAAWISTDDRLDEWTTQFFRDDRTRASVREFAPDVGDLFLRGPAPIAPIAPPQVTVLEDKEEAGLRQLHLRVTSGRAAPRISLYAGPETDICFASLNGIPLGENDRRPQVRRGERWGIEFQGLSYEGLDLQLGLMPGTPVEFVIIEESYGTPEFPELGFTPRPAYMIPEPNTVEWWRKFRSHKTYTTMTWRLDAAGPA